MTAVANTQTILLSGITTRYLVMGEGLDVILLHGWGANLNLMLPLAQQLQPLGYRTHLLDLPGFGESGLPPQAWSVHNYAQHVLAYMAHQNLERVHLFGHSFGGRISIVLGANHEHHIGKIVLCDAAGVKAIQPWYKQLPLVTYHYLKDKLPDHPLIEQLQTAYRNRTASTDYLNAGELKATFLAVIEEDLLPLSSKINQPTLLVWGTADQDTPLWQAKKLEATIPNAGLVTLEGAGHYSYLDRLLDVTRIVDYFYKHD
ncbi:MAG: alpha/beta fold hydrolase [Phototrophicaceae bacterium]